MEKETLMKLINEAIGMCRGFKKQMSDGKVPAEALDRIKEQLEKAN
jgi:hypothetical protein